MKTRKKIIEQAYKPGSVRDERAVAIYLGSQFPESSCSLPGSKRAAIAFLLNLAPDGVCQAGRSPGRW